MFRLWGKEWKDNRMVKDTVICDDCEAEFEIENVEVD